MTGNGQRQTVAVVGLGSIGGIAAACLAEAGRHDVIGCARKPIDKLTLERPGRTVTPPLPVITDPAESYPRRLGAGGDQDAGHRRRRALARAPVHAVDARRGAAERHRPCRARRAARKRRDRRAGHRLLQRRASRPRPCAHAGRRRPRSRRAGRRRRPRLRRAGGRDAAARARRARLRHAQVAQAAAQCGGQSDHRADHAASGRAAPAGHARALPSTCSTRR